MEIGDIFLKSSHGHQIETRYVRSPHRKGTFFDRRMVLLAPKWPSYYSGKLFGRWKKTMSEIRHTNNKPIHIEIEQGLFDDIYGFKDVKNLFEMAIHSERPLLASLHFKISDSFWTISEY